MIFAVTREARANTETRKLEGGECGVSDHDTQS